MKNFIPKYTRKGFYVFCSILILLSILISNVQAENIYTDYATIKGAKGTEKTVTIIEDRVDRCMKEIAKYLKYKPVQKNVVTIHVYNFQIIIALVCGNVQGIVGCTWRMKSYYSVPFKIHVSQDVYENSTLTHELVHVIVFLKGIEDRVIHETIAYKLEKKLCIW